MRRGKQSGERCVNVRGPEKAATVSIHFNKYMHKDNRYTFEGYEQQRRHGFRYAASMDPSGADLNYCSPQCVSFFASMLERNLQGRSFVSQDICLRLQ